MTQIAHRHGNHDPDHEGAQKVLGTGCPKCGTPIRNFEVHYQYEDYFEDEVPQTRYLGPEFNIWKLRPCGHEMTRDAWPLEGEAQVMLDNARARRA